MHFVSMGWKLLFAFVPPARLCKGWLSFVVSLMFIGIVTAVVGECASMFGCCIGLKPGVTAITFVALGTSLPDTFASKQAAQESEFADSAIGNVTGSNSVNVFLGLGLPWVIASIYYEAKGQKYVVPATGLSFSVMLFLITSIVCLMTLIVRRLILKGELGGKTWIDRYLSAAWCVSLWVIYILFSSLRSYNHV